MEIGILVTSHRFTLSVGHPQRFNCSIMAKEKSIKADKKKEVPASTEDAGDVEMGDVTTEKVC